MSPPPRSAWCNRRRHSHARACLQVEELEGRQLLSGILPLPMLSAAADNYTLNQAQDLGNLNTTGGAVVLGQLGSSSLGAVEVDWYRFTLTAPAAVSLSTLDQQLGSSFASVLSLYNSDPFDFGDYY